MTITALPPVPSRSDAPATFIAKADAFLAALPQFATEANETAALLNIGSVSDTSATSNVIGTGAKTFTVSAGKSFAGGMYLVIADNAAPSTNSMFCQVTSYSGITLIVNVLSIKGSGTKTAWIISLTSSGGAALGANSDITSITGLTTPLSVSQGGTGANSNAGAAFALKGANTDISSLAGLSAGAVGTPSVAPTGDTNTGVWFPAADTVAVSTGGNERFRIDSSGNLLVTNAAGLGYGSGSGGTVTQATSKATTVVLNKPCGQITLNAASLAANTSVTFFLTNSLMTTADTLNISMVNASGSNGAYIFTVTAATGTAVITVRNITAGALAEAIAINFSIVKGATA